MHRGERVTKRSLYAHFGSSCSTFRIKRSSPSASVGMSPKNGLGRDFFEKHSPSFSEGRLATNASNLSPPQSEMSPTNVRPRLTPGVLSLELALECYQEAPFPPRQV